MGVLMCVVIMALSALIALLAEAYSWYTVYRKPEYQRLKRHIENLVKDVEKKKAEPVGGSVEKKVKNLKALSRLEKDLAEATKDLQALTMSNKLVVAVTLMVVMIAINKSFAGIVVAKLPFVPISLVQKISHRALEGEDPTDCSVAFIFALCQAGVKGNIVKLVGVGHPKGMKEANPFAELGAPVEEDHAKVQ
ncbi:unnamed protein product [Ectocarpus sp. CCAP 1310/34]|nr:unnamed protein product [Ectocarpus sp. CCAP 1310/34]